MRVVVTRPAREARTWASALEAAGHEAFLLPLIEIGPAEDLSAVAHAWHALDSMRAAMFVSGNAAGHFFASRPSGAAWPIGLDGVRAWAPGPGTAQALRAAGVAPDLIDAPDPKAGQFDSEALWRVVHPQVRQGDTVLIVRGSDGRGQSAGREWLGDQLAAVGVGVVTVVAYQRRAPVWGPAECAFARHATQCSAVWLFSSSEAIAHLPELLPGHDWSGVSALATHPRIAQAARDAGFGVVRESRATLEAVLAALESSE